MSEQPEWREKEAVFRATMIAGPVMFAIILLAVLTDWLIVHVIATVILALMAYAALRLFVRTWWPEP